MNGTDNEALLRVNSDVVDSLQHAVLNAPRDVNTLRSALKNVLRDGAWLDRLDYRRQNQRYRYQAEEFLKFIADQLPVGLESSPDTIRRFIADDKEALVLFEQAIDRGRGGTNNPEGRNEKRKEEVKDNNVIIDQEVKPRPSKKIKQGYTVAYGIRRLGKERPELLEEVKAGTKSVNRAMIEAGFRKVPTPLEQIRRLLPRLTAAERGQLRDELSQGRPAVMPGHADGGVDRGER
jgi:hypothetical protein